MKRIEILGCPMDVATIGETSDVITNAIKADQFIQHVVVNVAKLVNMRSDSVLDRSVRECDIINIDGMGLVFAARLLGYDVRERVAGIDLFHRLVGESASQDLPIFLLGGTQDVVEKAASNIEGTYPNVRIAGIHHGYFWDDEPSVVKLVRDSGAKLLFVAITSPKKENFIARWQAELGVNFVMGVGGTFDILAGKITRAPLWMQSAGLEWLYRLLQEPVRLFGRYARTNGIFALLLVREMLFGRRASRRINGPET